MANSTNQITSINASTRDNLADHLLAASSIAIISCPSLVIYVLFVFVALGNANFNQNPYFILAGSLGIADIFTVSLMLLYAVPSIIFQRNIGGPILHRAVGSIMTLGWYASLPLMLAMGINRYLCVCKKHYCEKVFTLKNTKSICGLCWGIGGCYFFLSLSEQCAFKFLPEVYSWTWNVPHTCAVVITYSEIAIVLSVCLATMATNAAVFRVFRRMHSAIKDSCARPEMTRQQTELKLFLQFFVTAIVLAGFDLLFNVTLFVSGSKWLYLGVTVLYTVNCSINGWVYFALGETVRKEILNRIRFHRKPTTKVLFIRSPRAGVISKIHRTLPEKPSPRGIRSCNAAALVIGSESNRF